MGALHACISKCCEGRSFLRRVGPSRAVESRVPLFSRGLFSRFMCLFSRFMSSLTSPDEVSRSTTMGRGCRPAGWERQRVDFAGRGPSTHGMVATEFIDPSTQVGCSVRAPFPSSASSWMGRQRFDDATSCASDSLYSMLSERVSDAVSNSPTYFVEDAGASRPAATVDAWKQNTTPRRLTLMAVGLCSVAALVHMVSAECRASCEVQCCPYATDIDVILTLAQGDYLTAKAGDRSEPSSAGRRPP